MPSKGERISPRRMRTRPKSISRRSALEGRTALIPARSERRRNWAWGLLADRPGPRGGCRNIGRKRREGVGLRFRFYSRDADISPPRAQRLLPSVMVACTVQLKKPDHGGHRLGRGDTHLVSGRGGPRCRLGPGLEGGGGGRRGRRPLLRQEPLVFAVQEGEE